MQRNNNLVKGVKAVLGSAGLGQSFAQLNVTSSQEIEIRGASVEEQNTIHVIRPSMVEYHKKQLAERKKLIDRELKKMREKKKKNIPTKRIKFTAPSNDGSSPVPENFKPEDSVVYTHTPKYSHVKRITATSSTRSNNTAFKNGEPVPEELLCDFLKRQKVVLEGEFSRSKEFIKDCLTLSGAVKAARFRPEPGMVMVIGLNTCPERKSAVLENDSGVQIICESDLINIAVATHDAELALKRQWEASPVLNPPKPHIVHSDAAPAAASSSVSSIPSLAAIDEAISALNQLQNHKTETATSLINDISTMKSLHKGASLVLDQDLASVFGVTVKK